MLLTVSTVKDSVENVSFFVAANLASGVDHLVVFLDAPRDPGQREVGELLDAHPQVTCVRAGRRGWWQGDRPPGLNVRQRINANLTRTALEPLGWAEWLFHIDGDEVARLDRAALAEVPEDVDAVWLPPREAVSEWDAAARPTHFKHLLGDAELTLLQVLGAIPQASNQAYFHGHVMGKSGVRPRSGLGLTLHQAVTPGGERAVAHQDARLAVLHYDGVSGEEFVRKWSALADAGPARYRASRAPTARALRTLVGRDLPDDVRLRYLRRIYDRTTRDDVEVLGELGLLEEVDPLASPVETHPLAQGQESQLAARLADLGARPKSAYLVSDARDRGDSRKAGRPLASLRRLVTGG